MEILLGLIFGLIPVGLLVLLIIYISKTNSLGQRLTLIQMELASLRKLVDELSDHRTETAAMESAISSSMARPPIIPEPPAAPLPPVIVAGEMPISLRSQPTEDAPLYPKPKTSRTREEWEAIIGGKLLNRIGALALIIGIGFFLKYAFDNDWITETMRVTIGVVVGAILLVIAHRAHKKTFEVFAQGLVGAGLATLYLSVFASFSFYHLVPQAVAFLMMSVVTVLAFLQAFKYDSLAVSLLGMVGGFLTPFLLSTGEASEVGLFTYIALLDAGILAVLLMKDRWAVLEPLSLGATYLIYLLWYKEFYTPDVVLTSAYFLVVFWALYFSLEVYRSLKSAGSFQELRAGVAIANLVFFYGAMYSLIEPEHHNLMGIATLLLGAVYFLTSLIVQRRRAVSTFMRQVVIAVILLVVATAVEFTGFRTVIWWSVEALLLMVCGLRWNIRLVWLSAIAVYGCAIVKLLFNADSFGSSPVVEGSLLFNQRVVTFLMLAASMAVSTWWLRKRQEVLHTMLARILDHIWPALLFAVITAEITGHFMSLKLAATEGDIRAIDFKELMSLPVVWMMYSIPLFWFGILKKVTPWQHVALGVVLLSVGLAAIRGVSYVPVEEFQLLLNFRVLTILLVLIGALLHARWLRKRIPLGKWNANALHVVGVIAVGLLLVLITGETRDYFEKAKSLLESDASRNDYSRLANLQQLSLSGVWLLYSILLMIVGIWRRHRGIRIISIVLFGFTILKIFVYDLSFLETLYRIFSFIGLGVILLAVSFLYQKYKDVILGLEKPNGEPSRSSSQV